MPWDCYYPVMRRSCSGFTLVEGLLVLAILGFIALMFIPTGPVLVKQSRYYVSRQQAVAIQDALERWMAEQPTLAAARTTFNSNPLATGPASQVAFFSTYVAPLLDSTMGADVTANSTASALGSTQMNLCGASATIYWDTNYTVNHPKVNLVLPP
jgi:type II secretory pathway pseudopilin PulG